MGDDATTIGGRYRVLMRLGQGGLGAVYKAFDTRLKKVVAVKVFANRSGITEKAVLANLNHPNLLCIYDFVESDGLPCQVMEYVEGRSLQQILSENGYLDLDYAVGIIRQASAGLGHAHKQGLIHRDVKPSNILVTTTGRVVVSDFDLATAPGVSTLSEVGTIRGTPAYMSPEQAMGKPVDARSDIFQLAAVLYECLTGERPFRASTAAETIQKIVEQSQSPRRLRELNPRLPQAVENAILRALAKDPGQRFQSMEQFDTALSDAILIETQDIVVSPVRAPGAPEIDKTWDPLESFIRVTSPQTLEADPTTETLPYEPRPDVSAILRQTETSTPWLMALTGPLRGRQIRLGDSFRIGRGSDNDLQLGHEEYVSRRHAEIYVAANKFFIRDLSSKIGTMVNGRRVHDQELRDRDEILIGRTILMFFNGLGSEPFSPDTQRRIREFEDLWKQLTRSASL